MNAQEFWSKYQGQLPWLQERTIFLTKHGSHAYGTNIPTSDIDIKGIAVPPREYWHGFLNSFEQAEIKGELDAVVYDIRKFFKLAADCNPSIIEVLHTKMDDWVYPAPNDTKWGFAWANLHAGRHLFMSKKAKFTFSGYAISQLKRINTHRRWLLNPPAKKPEREDYGLKGETTLGKDQFGVLEARIKKIEDGLSGEGWTRDKLEDVDEGLVTQAIKDTDLHINLIPLIVAERKYKAACRNWAQWQEWKKERNAIRSEMETKYGYDTKHAMHLVRLMRMCKEILVTGLVQVKRPDAEELLAIRYGAWTYEALMDWAQDMEVKLEELYPTSPLPREPDRKALDALLIRIVESML